MAKSYTFKTNSDGSTTTTKENNDGTKISSTNIGGAKDYDFKAGAYVTNDVAKANSNTYSTNGSKANYKYRADGTAYVDNGNTSNVNKTINNQSNTNANLSRDELVNAYANAVKKQQLAQLKNAYNRTLNEISEQERQTQQTAQENRNQASVQSQLAQRNLANYMANAGLTNSGTNAQ